MFCFLAFGCQYQCGQLPGKVVSETICYVSSGTLNSDPHSLLAIRFIFLTKLRGLCVRSSCLSACLRKMRRKTRHCLLETSKQRWRSNIALRFLLTFCCHCCSFFYAWCWRHILYLGLSVCEWVSAWVHHCCYYGWCGRAIGMASDLPFEGRGFESWLRFCELEIFSGCHWVEIITNGMLVCKMFRACFGVWISK